MPPKYVFYLRIVFFFTIELEEKIKKYWGESGGKGCLYIRDCYNLTLNLS